jgi:predicted RNA-binding protein associated with RNAse of E/G family
MPDGRMLIFDEDELYDAYEAGYITKDELDMAYHVLNKLIENKIISLSYLEELCSRLRKMF